MKLCAAYEHAFAASVETKSLLKEPAQGVWGDVNLPLGFRQAEKVEVGLLNWLT